MKERQQENVHFGISLRLGLAIGFISIIIAVMSFSIAEHLNKVLTVATVLDKNWVVAEHLAHVIGTKDMAELLARERSIYGSLSGEELADPTDRTYQSRYEELKTPAYEYIFNELDQSAGIEKIMWADVRFKDEKSGRYVYLMHTGEKEDGTYGIGYWENDDDRINCTVVSDSRWDAKKEEMTYLPPWVQSLADMLPRTLRNVPGIIDSFLVINNRNPSNRFSILYPIESADTGETVGYLGIGEYYTNYASYNWAFKLTFAAVIIPWFILIVFLARAIVNRSIVDPIQKLAKAAVAYGRDEDKQKNGEHFKKVEIRSRDEVLLLRDSMADMEESLHTYMEHLQEMTAKEERFKAEMDMSANIQMGMLPQTLEDNGKGRDFTISASIRPARAVGGDFYDFFMIDDDRVGIVIADVSGKGMPAAMFMMIAKVILATMAKTGVNAAEVMRGANLLLCDNNPETLFVTIWFGIYHVKERTVRYVNAGHDYPALYRHEEGKFSFLREDNDFSLGILPEAEFKEQTISLKQGDKLFLYTDGIPEAHNEAEEMYGEDRLLAVLDESAEQTQDRLLCAVSDNVYGFIGEAEQFDDMTMVLLEIG